MSFSIRLICAVVLLVTTMTATLSFAAITGDSTLTMAKLSTRVLADWRVQQINKVQERTLRYKRLLEQVRAGGDSTCVSERREEIRSIEAQLQVARECKFNGLSLDEFNAQKEICFTRAASIARVETLIAQCATKTGDALVTCRATLAAARVTLANAQTACEAIGRPVPGQIPDCPAVMPLKEELARVTATECPTSTSAGGFTEDELEALIETGDARITELLNGEPVPASEDPRFPIGF